MDISKNTTVEEFIERMGLIAEGDGLPRIAGRIMGLMVIDGGPLSFTELAEQLAVSRGSISTNTRFLEHLGVIERVAQRGERQDYFRLATAPYVRLLQGSVDRAVKAHSVVAHARSQLSVDDEGAKRRLDELSAFYEELGNSFRDLAKRFSRED
jgi:DNA-binding transcriptional regulator GbsR (MarR family)